METLIFETIVQSKGESLCDYVAQFDMEALRIPHLENSRTIEAIMKYKYIRQDDSFRTTKFIFKH